MNHSDQDRVRESVSTKMRSIISSSQEKWGHVTAEIADILNQTWEQLLRRREDGIPHAFEVLIAHGWNIEQGTTIICAAELEEYFLSIHESLQDDQGPSGSRSAAPLWSAFPGTSVHDRRASALIAADLCAVMSSSLLADLDAPSAVRVAGLRSLSEGVMERSIDRLNTIIESPSVPAAPSRLLERLVHAMTDSALLTASPRSGVPPEHIS